MSEAAKLKEEGNAFFVKKDYNLAIRKYTQSIKLDKRNTVLYSNRAACHLAMLTYHKAIEDAQKAVEIDPGYSKAWARLASAEDGLQAWQQALTSWERAVKSLPNENLTPTQAKQRAEYEAGLKLARTRFADIQKKSWGSDNKSTDRPGYIHRNFIGKKQPGQRAVEMLDRLRREGRTHSSAFVIAEAYLGLMQGLEAMSTIKTMMVPTGQAVMGQVGVLDRISNGIMQDNRCFHISDPNFANKFNLQLQYESIQTGAPQDLRSSDAIISYIRGLHAQSGFEKSKYAVGIAVRVLICRAYIEGGINQTHAASVGLYDIVLGVLNWGRSEWSGVPASVRGTVFEDTFVRGVRNMRLEAYMQAWVKDQKSKKITLEGLLKEAEDIVQDVRAHPVNVPGDIGFNYAFGSYIEGHALSMQGLYWNKKAREGKLKPKEGQAQFRKAGELYLEAANCYPEDDEHHLSFTKVGLDILFGAAAPLKETMPLMQRIRTLVPAVKETWELSQLSLMGTWEQYDDLEWFEKQMQALLDSRKCTLEDMFQPSWADTRYLK